MHKTELEVQTMKKKLREREIVKSVEVKKIIAIELSTVPENTGQASQRDFERRSIFANKFTKTVKAALKESKPKNVEMEEKKEALRVINKSNFESESFAVFGRCIVNLGRGDSFGEASLISGKPRAASVIAREKCEMVLIEKADYDSIVANCNVIFDPSKKNKLIFCKYFLKIASFCDLFDFTQIHHSHNLLQFYLPFSQIIGFHLNQLKLTSYLILYLLFYLQLYYSCHYKEFLILDHGFPNQFILC